MKTENRLFTFCALALGLACTGPVLAKSDAVASPANAANRPKELAARNGLTTSEVDAATAKAAKLAPKMTVAQVERIMGKLTVAGKGGGLVDMLNALPLAPDVQVTGTDGIFRYDFVANEKGRFLLKTWELLPGAQPSR